MNLGQYASLRHIPIIGEADRLKIRRLERPLVMNDQNHFEVVLIGMPGLEKCLAHYPHFRKEFSAHSAPLNAN
jgi:DNA transposition AAA+ family ATPase